MCKNEATGEQWERMETVAGYVALVSMVATAVVLWVDILTRLDLMAEVSLTLGCVIVSLQATNYCATRINGLGHDR